MIITAPARAKDYETALDSVSVVIPAHNEVDSIESVVRGFWRDVACELKHGELVVAEDGSTDGTKEVLARLARELPIRVISGDARKGYLRGVRDALRAAEREWVFFSDSDGTHDPKDFWKLHAKAAEGFDLVAGAKERRQDARYRLWFSAGYNGLVRRAFGVTIPDVNGGFKLMTGAIAKEIAPRVRHLPYGFSTELVIRAQHAGARVASVPVKHYARSHGRADQFEPGAMPRVVWRQARGLLALHRELSGEMP